MIRLMLVIFSVCLSYKVTCFSCVCHTTDFLEFSIVSFVSCILLIDLVVSMNVCLPIDICIKLTPAFEYTIDLQ